MQTNTKQLYIRIMLGLLFGISFIRILAFSVHFGSHSLQMDFSAFYTAGEALNSGISPYINHISHPQPIWDGTDRFKHSRFLYPPLVANLFQPIAALPYFYAKQLWMIISLASLFLSLLISFNVLFADNERSDNFVIQSLVGIFTCLYYPLLTLLERGQIDSITLLLLIIGISTMIKRQHSLWPGILFSIATLLKLHVVFIVPFLILRKQWTTVLGYMIGCIIIGVLTLALDGTALSVDYAFEQLPRISRYGEAGTDAMKVPDQAIQQFLQGVPAGFTLKDGRIYQPSSFDFSSNATLARTKVAEAIRSIVSSFGINMSMTMLSAILFSLFLIVVVIWGRAPGMPSQRQAPQSEFGYWLMVLMIILLCAPLTWVMNTIWLLPAAVLFIYHYLELRSAAADRKVLHAVLLCMGTTGLLIAALPDHRGFQMLWPAVGQLADQKYVVAELLVDASLFGYWAYKCRRHASTGANGA